MPYKPPASESQPQQCEICRSPANSRQAWLLPRCGLFALRAILLWGGEVNWLPSFTDDEQRALASHLIRKMQQESKRPILNDEFFTSLSGRSLPTPTEMSDNLLLLIAERSGGRPGRPISLNHSDDLALQASIGAVDAEDALWAVRNLKEQNLLKGSDLNYLANGWLTAAGWERIEELKRAHVSSRYAFFARQFKNDDLDTLFDNCLKKAVADTGYELRTVPQKAGHIDAIIEDDIRRCRFVVADLSDDNAGAYWEAGLAEGLGRT